MRISELAKLSGLSIDTIRFYEKEKLLDEQHFERLENNYRSYNITALERLDEIKCAKHTGFTLSEIKAMTSDLDVKEMTREQKEAILQYKLRDIDGRITKLEKLKEDAQKRLEALREEPVPEI